MQLLKKGTKVGGDLLWKHQWWNVSHSTLQYLECRKLRKVNCVLLTTWFLWLKSKEMFSGLRVEGLWTGVTLLQRNGRTITTGKRFWEVIKQSVPVGSLWGQHWAECGDSVLICHTSFRNPLEITRLLEILKYSYIPGFFNWLLYQRLNFISKDLFLSAEALES